MTTTAPASTRPLSDTTTPVAAPTRTLGILSLVFGIISIVSGFQFIVGAAAIVMGVLALRQEPASGKLALAGIITGAVSAVGIVWSAFGFLAFLPFMGMAPLFW